MTACSAAPGPPLSWLCPQWMVLDVHRLEQGRASDVLWVLEQIPGETVSEDATEVRYPRVPPARHVPNQGPMTR